MSFAIYTMDSALLLNYFLIKNNKSYVKAYVMVGICIKQSYINAVEKTENNHRVEI